MERRGKMPKQSNLDYVVAFERFNVWTVEHDHGRIEEKASWFPAGMVSCASVDEATLIAAAIDAARDGRVFLRESVKATPAVKLRDRKRGSSVLLTLTDLDQLLTDYSVDRSDYKAAAE
jgi:hypothetical protein